VQISCDIIPWLAREHQRAAHDGVVEPVTAPPAKRPRGRPAFPGGGPAVAALERVRWGATPLGSPDQWPGGLRTAVEVALGSRFPMCLMWGPTHVLIYNDGYLPILGHKHPRAMGRPAREPFAEVWHTVGPLVEHVLRTGEPTWNEDERLLLDRGGGPEEAFFTFSFSPVRDGGDAPAGVFASVLETTEHVLARRRAAALSAAVAAAVSAHDADEALQLAAAAAVGADLPWLAVYRVERGTQTARLVASAGLAEGAVDAAAALALADPAAARVLGTDRATELDPAALGIAGVAPRALGVRIPGAEGPSGVLAAGVSPHVAVDEACAEFVLRLARSMGTALDRGGRLARAERERIEVLERMADGFFALDREWRFTYLNPEAERVSRRPAGSLIGRACWDEFPHLRGTVFEEGYRRAMAEQVPVRFTASGPEDDGWREVHVYPSPEGISVFFRDATDRVRVEAERAELLRREQAARADAEAAERRLLDLVEGLDAIVWEADAHPFAFTFVSERARRLVGYPVERFLEEPGFWRAVIHPEDRPWVQAFAAAEVAALRDHALEYRVVAADGRTLWMRDTVRVTRAPDGGVHLRGVMVDVTGRRRSEDEVRRLAAIVESTDDAVLAKAADGTLLSWNAGAERTFGWREHEVVGRTIFDLIPPELHAEEREILARVFAGERVTHFETRRTTRDGRTVHVSLTVSPIVDANGRVQCAASILRDVTDERRLQAQLRQAQKMEAVGRLAGGVAHDFNNLLTAIKGNAGLLLADLPSGSPLREDVEEIDRAAQRASDLTRQLLAFSRRQVLQPRIVDLNAVIGETRRMLRRLIEEDVEIVVDLAPGVGPVKADPGQVEQVLLNLAVNARDAMPGGGRLTISTADAAVPPEPREGWPYYVPAGQYVRLDVVDTGVGMEPQVLAHLFEPFFTTKPAGKGTGLGLSTVYGIVKQSGGYVWAEIEPERGSRFVVLLPRVADDEPGAAGAEEAAPLPGRGATVLLVEDEDSVRSLTRRVLQRAGYQVLEAEDGERALAIARAHAGAIDLLLTDVVMPGGGGRRLAERMAAFRPSTRVLYMSGYPGDAIAEHGLEPGVDLLPKPFTPESLLRRVADALGGD
jgi:PAS domain S-box-containing protein